MLVYLRDGSAQRPSNMLVYLRDGSAKRPSNMLVYLRDGSAKRPSNMLVYLRDGSAKRPSNMLVYLRDGSAKRPINMLVYLRDGSAQTVLRAATLRHGEIPLPLDSGVACTADSAVPFRTGQQGWERYRSQRVFVGGLTSQQHANVS